MITVAVSRREIDNEIWLTCEFNNKIHIENACSYKEAEKRLRLKIGKANPLIDRDDLEFEPVDG